MSSSESSFWKDAVNSEIDSILNNHTWELVDLPPKNKPLGSKWIFKRKMKADGTIDKYKARLVVKGFKQKKGLDYFDTYSPVTRLTSILMLIALAAVYGLEIHQMDVKTAFLNGELEEEIYMEQPEGFVVPEKENKVCKLIKSLYGLKQTPKQWHAKFDQTMLANRIKIKECDKCVYIKDTPNHQVIVCLYVVDILIISRDISDINAIKRMLESKFNMKDLGVADVILGIGIHRTPQRLALSQSYYIKNVLEKFKYMEFGIAKNPLDVSFALRKNKGKNTGVMSGAMIYVKKEFQINDSKTEILARILNLCALVGSLSAGTTSDAIGRRNTMIVASIIFLLGSVLMGYGPNYVTLLGGRCVAGVGVGFALMIAPVYSAEISSPKTRGFLTSLPEIGN
ncbi:putative polyol transporter 3 [Capsicum chinense]|nr:putative polyol transporter 3 [Capsicum chinense]